MDRQMRIWAEVDLDAIEKNYRNIRAQLKPGTRFLGVVKANAYGHGSVRVAQLLQELGCDYLAVACLQEATQLRENGVTMPILILGYTDPKYTEDLIKYNITQSVSCLEMAQEMSKNAGDKTLRVHLKLDSGMGRMGFTVHSGADHYEEIGKALGLPGLEYEGVFTHFAVSDVQGQQEYTNMQYEAFCSAVERIEATFGVKFKIKHCTNSGAMISYNKTYLDMVRPGIVLYGCYPDADHGALTLTPAMSLKARVAQIKDFASGDSISYGRIFKAEKSSRVAVVTVGYADGLHRVLSNKAQFLINGKRVNQIGRICMDMCMVDVTDRPDVKVGDAVTIFGFDGDVLLPVDEQAQKADTISYELLCAVAERVDRVYIRHGQIEP